MKRIRCLKKMMCYIIAFVFMISLLPNVFTETEAAGVDNIVARADYLYNIKWTAQKSVNGWKNRSDTKYEKGKTYRIPYGQPVSAGKYICWGISVDDFYDATMDGDSAFYSKRSKNGTAESVYYAMDCSAFVSYCWGLSSRTDTRSWPNLSVNSYGKCTTTNVQKLQKGDALNLSGSHIVLVTDVIKSGDKVTKIEITEQTPPQIKRTIYTADSLASAYSSYTIYRYKNRDAVKAPPVPATPKITSVSATADTEITIKWGEVAGATKYVVHGRKAGGEYAKIAEVTGTSYTHKNLDGGSLYWYKVKAVNSTGESGYSSASASYTKPSTPTTTDSSVDSLTVKWSSSGGSTNYELLARKSGDDEYVTIAENIEGYTYTHRGLEAGTQYYYKVKAHNKEHPSIVSMRSDAGTGVTNLNTPTLVAKTAKTVSLDWERGPLNGEHTYTYRVCRKEAKDSSYAGVAVMSNSSYVDSGLKPNTTYHYYIDVLKNGIYLINSNVLTVTTDAQYAESVSVTPNTITLTEGDTYSLLATVLPSDTTNKSVTWTSDNTSVADVSSNGTITAKQPGTANITVKTANGKSAVCRVLVESLQDNCTHSYGDTWTTTTQATCTSIGHKYRECSICGKVEEESVPATGHTYSAEWTVTKEATCTEPGERRHLCTVCGEEDVYTVEIIDMIAHDCGEEWTVLNAPTCAEPGLQYKTCVVCNGIGETEEIPVVAHTYAESWIIEQEATCQQEKVLSRSCINCDEKEYYLEEKIEHNYVATDVKDSTYTEEGYATYVCSYCADTYTDIIPKDTMDSEIIVEHVVASSGDTVDVRISLVNNPGIIYGKFEVTYDDVLTLVDVKDNGLLGNANHSNNKKSPYILYWNNGTATEDYTADGTIVTLTFKIADDAEEGSYIVDIREVESSTFNYNDETVYFSAVGGNIIVNNTIIGDVNGDGEVTARDERDLSRYIAGWVGYEEINLRAADVNGDGEVTARDERDLSRHIAGWIGYETLPKK